MLFNVVLEISPRRSKVETWRTIFDKCSQIMAYADDVVIMRRRSQDVTGVFTALVEQTYKGIRNKWKKGKMCDSITKVLH